MTGVSEVVVSRVVHLLFDRSSSSLQTLQMSDGASAAAAVVVSGVSSLLRQVPASGLPWPLLCVH
jgi:hypothetical protein